MLLEGKANPDPKVAGKGSDTPIRLANSSELMVALFAAGAGLHAANKIFLRVCGFLIPHGRADPNVVDKDGNTPLHKAESAELMTALLKAGANPDVPDKVNKPYLLCPFIRYE